MLRCDVLGPLRVTRGETELDLGFPQQRALLALLLVHTGRPVRLAGIVDVLWSGQPPASAPNVVRRYVGALRRLLEPGLPPRAPGRRLLGRTGGYVLHADTDEVDLLRFRDLTQRGMRAAATARPETAVRHFAAALRLWRGPVATGAPAATRAHPHFTAVERELVRTAQMAADAALLCGSPEAVLPTLRRAAALEPLDEPLHARLVLSLAAAGLQAEALGAYDGVRRDLAAQLGVPPGPELTAAHARVLRQQVRPAAPRTPPPTPPERPRPPYPFGAVIGLSYETSYQSGTLHGGLCQLPTAHDARATTVSVRMAARRTSTRTQMSHLRAPAARADRREGGRHGRPVARPAPALPETHIRPQLMRLAVLPPTAVALSASAAVIFGIRSTGAHPGPTLWAVLAGATAVAAAAVLIAAVAADRAA
ncbi:AfsR/SARP family transcriptional regulator, partial [Streptomyces collinus]